MEVEQGRTALDAGDSSTPGTPQALAAAGQDRKVLTALGDPVSLSLLAALSRGERDGHTLVLETRLPQSSIYRKLHDLQEDRLVQVSRLAFTPEGRKVEVFSSRIREVLVEFTNGLTLVRVRRREDAADRITSLWEQVRAK